MEGQFEKSTVQASSLKKKGRYFGCSSTKHKDRVSQREVHPSGGVLKGSVGKIAPNLKLAGPGATNPQIRVWSFLCPRWGLFPSLPLPLEKHQIANSH